MKKIFIIPGYRHKSGDQAYIDLVNVFEKKKLASIVVPIKWKYSAFNKWLAEFDAFYEKNKAEETVLLGFSYGAMIALAAAVKIQPKLLILCSLSPYFKEDLVTMKKSWVRAIGKRQMADFEKVSFNELAKNIKSKTILLLGEKETIKYPELADRVKIAHQKISSKLVMVPNGDHNIGQKEYLEAIGKIEL